jgi:hypothetical protein
MIDRNAVSQPVYDYLAPINVIENPLCHSLAKQLRRTTPVAANQPNQVAVGERVELQHRFRFYVRLNGTRSLVTLVVVKERRTYLCTGTSAQPCENGSQCGIHEGFMVVLNHPCVSIIVPPGYFLCDSLCGAIWLGRVAQVRGHIHPPIEAALI